METLNAAALVAKVRSQSGLTQADLAARAGTSQAAVARYETGASTPSTATLTRLLRAGGFELEVALRKTSASDLSTQRAKKIRQLRGPIKEIMKDAGARNIRIFGSVARGDDNAASDIDFLVDFDTSKGLLPIVGLVAKLKKLLGENVDVAPVSALKNSVLESALKEAIPL